MTTTKKRPEVLVPAGTLEKLKVAVNYGADAVFVGGQAYGLRSRAGNFTMDELREGIEYAHARGVDVHVASNMVTHEGNEKVLVNGSASCVIWDSMLLSYLTQP